MAKSIMGGDGKWGPDDLRGRGGAHTEMGVVLAGSLNFQLLRLMRWCKPLGLVVGDI